MPKDKEIICGVKEPTKKQRRGTMKECAEMKQVRYWGLKKVDKILLEKITEKPDKKKYSKDEAIGKARGFEGKGKKLKLAIEDAKKNRDKKEVEKLTEEYEKVRKQYTKFAKLANKLMKEK